MLAVVGLPVLLPLAALLQLLFPGLLRDQWRNYRARVQVLLAQSTIVFVHWALLRWAFTLPPWWLSDQMLWAPSSRRRWWALSSPSGRSGAPAIL